MKYTSHDLYTLSRILAISGDRLNIISGPDELFVPCQVIGAQGAIGTTYNFMPRPYLEAYRALQSGDIAQARMWQARANRVLEIIFRFSVLSATKEVMRMLDLDCGEPRRPLRPLTPTERADLKARLVEAGLFDLV
ncbi:MAG TPA: hypothetical protein EYP04_08085 [Anaerolineae bacterium]|nr:hypothetical protein [Anaerolineae bacterium]